jgi:hypothetical protein
MMRRELIVAFASVLIASCSAECRELWASLPSSSSFNNETEPARFHAQPWGRDAVRIHMVRKDASCRSLEAPVLSEAPTPRVVPGQQRAGCNTTTFWNDNLRVELNYQGNLWIACKRNDKVLLRGYYLEDMMTRLPGSWIQFASDPQEHLVGMGEHRLGRVLLKPFDKVFRHRSFGRGISIPVMTSTRGYVFLLIRLDLEAYDTTHCLIGRHKTPVSTFGLPRRKLQRPMNNYHER